MGGGVWKGSRPRSDETCGRDVDSRGKDLGVGGYCKEVNKLKIEVNTITQACEKPRLVLHPRI